MYLRDVVSELRWRLNKRVWSLNTTPVVPDLIPAEAAGITGGSEVIDALSAHWQGSMHALCNLSRASLSIVLGDCG